MCSFILSSRFVFDIAAVAILAVFAGMIIYAAYTLILGWGDPETTRHVRWLFLKALGWLAIAILIDNADNILC